MFQQNDKSIDQQKQEKYHQLLGQQQQQQEVSNSIQSQKSTYYDKYQEFFQPINNFDVQKLMKQKIHILQSNKISYNSQTFTEEMTILFISHTDNWQIISMLVGLSYLTFQITVLNLSYNSVFNELLEPILGGSMGKIYQLKTINNGKFIVKSLQYVNSGDISRDKSNFKMQRGLADAIKQYCLTKLCSVLEIGPKILDCFGFDILIFQQTAEFAIEFCDPIKSFNIPQLKNHLKILHYLHIVHADIKLENLMWSNSYNKMVLIDFGLSTVVKEKIGELSFTHYFGTYNYCLQEMKDLLTKQSFGYVDLYFNDLYATILCESSYTKGDHLKILKIINDSQFSHVKQMQIILTNFELQKLIYDRNINTIQEYCGKNPVLSIQDQTLYLFKFFQPNTIFLKILCLLQQKYALQPERTFVHKKYHSGVYIRSSNIDNKKSTQTFQRRFKQNIKQNQSAITGIMLFLLLVYKQDVTPRAKYRKQQLKKQIYKCKQPSLQYWKIFVQFISNLHTTKQDILEVFQFIKQILGIKQWKMCQKQYQVYIKAFQLSLQIKQMYNINIFQLNYSIRYQKVEEAHKQIDQKIQAYSNYLLSWIKQFKPFVYYNYGNLGKYSFVKVKKNSRNAFAKKLMQQLLGKKNKLFQDFKSQVFQNNKFFIQLTKFDAASKSSPNLFKIQYFESQFQVEHNILLNQNHKYQKSQKSINRCLEINTLVYFYFASQIQTKINKKIPNLFQCQQGLIDLSNFLIVFLQKQVFFTFSMCYYRLLPKLQIYVDKHMIYHCLKMLQKQYFPIYKKAIDCKLISNLNCLIATNSCYGIFSQYLSIQQLKEQLQYLKFQIPFKAEGPQENINYITLIYLIIRYKLFIRLRLITPQDKLRLLRNFEYVKRQQKTIDTKDNQYKFFQIRLNSQIIQACLQTNTDAHSYVQKIQSLIFSLSKQLIIDYSRRRMQFCPLMSMFYATKPIQYFERGFAFAKYFIYQNSENSTKQIERVFSMYIFLRNCVWPYIIKQNIPQIIRHYMIQFDKIKKLQPQFFKIYANGIVVLQMLICAVFTFKIQHQTNWMLPHLLRYAVLWMNYASSFARRRFEDKLYTIIIRMIMKKMVNVKSQRQFLYIQLKQLRNRQYAQHLQKQNLKHWQILLYKLNNKNRHKTQIFSMINKTKNKIHAWQINKIERVNIRFVSNLGFQQIRIFQQIINQNQIQASINVKELQAGYLQYTEQNKYII